MSTPTIVPDTMGHAPRSVPCCSYDKFANGSRQVRPTIPDGSSYQYRHTITGDIHVAAADLLVSVFTGRPIADEAEWAAEDDRRNGPTNGILLAYYIPASLASILADLQTIPADRLHEVTHRGLMAFHAWHKAGITTLQQENGS